MAESEVTSEEIVIRGYMLGLRQTAQMIIDQLKSHSSGAELRFLTEWGPQIAREHFNSDASIASGDHRYHRLEAEAVMKTAKASMDAESISIETQEALKQLMILAEPGYLYAGVVTKNKVGLVEHFAYMQEKKLVTTLLSFAEEVQLPEPVISYLKRLDTYLQSLPPQEKAA